MYKFTGHLLEPIMDMKGRLTLLFAPKEDIRDAYNELNGEELLTLEIDKYHARRSLNANSYFHVLVGRIADALRISKQYCKNILITRYGQQEFLPDGSPVVIKTNVPAEKMMEQESLHCLPCGTKVEDETEVTFYKVYRGSHTYNSLEMAVLIDGTVQEAKDLGLETLPPSELAEMYDKWGKIFEKGQEHNN